jgi:eukaryotic-like serine/threonine-protein kinase
MSGPTSFLDELKRRKVVRVMVVYVSAVFALLQLVSVVVEPLGLPSWTMTLVIVLSGAGFVLALVLAWVFEVTPEGAAAAREAQATSPGAAKASGGATLLGSAARTGAAAPPVRWLPASTVLLVVALLAVGGVAGWAISPGSLHSHLRGASAAGSPAIRLDLTLPDTQRLDIPPTHSLPLALSPDGRLLAYVAVAGGGARLFVRSLDDYDARAVPGTEGAEQPFFSPDGRWIAFFAAGALRKVPVSGGAPIPIATDIEEPSGGSWGPGDVICFATAGGGLYAVHSGGGAPAPVRGVPGDTARPASSGTWPRFIDADHVVFSAQGDIRLLTLRTGETRALTDGVNAWYVAPDHLLVAAEEVVRAVGFDPRAMRVTSAPVPVLDQVYKGPGAGSASLAVSATGTLVYAAGGYARSLVIVDRNGRESPVRIAPRGFRYPHVSPDGRYVAVTVDPRPSNIWIVDLLRETATPLTTNDHNIQGLWSPDASRLVFVRAPNIVWMAWPARGAPVEVAPDSLLQVLPAPLRDGRVLAVERHAGRGRDIVVLDPVSHTARPFLATPAGEYLPAISPDGRWVAYVSDVSGAQEVYVVPFSKSAPPTIVSIGGGTDPVWSRDGRQLFYRIGQRIMAVRWSPGESARPGVPEALFAGSYDFTEEGNWDVLPDGRFIFVKADPSTTQRLHVVLGFGAELGRESKQ